MLIDFNLPILDIRKKPIPTPDGVLTIGDICIESLCGGAKGEEITQKTKIKRGLLAERIVEAQEAKTPIDLDFDEIRDLRDLVGKTGSSLLVLRASAILDTKKIAGNGDDK